MALWLLVIAWLVVFLVLGIWIGIKAWRLVGKAKVHQAEVQRHITNAKLNELNAKLQELQEKREALVEAVDRLEVSIEQLGILRSATKRALEPLFLLRALLRGT
jgi:uncharacterized membrane-anchored protein YhcB (DUF1043 family)